MQTKPSPVILTLHAESQSKSFDIVSFSMLEPSVYHVLFQTKDGQVLESRGAIVNYTGDLNALPPCAFSRNADCVRKAFGPVLRS